MSSVHRCQGAPTQTSQASLSCQEGVCLGRDLFHLRSEGEVQRDYPEGAGRAANRDRLSGGEEIAEIRPIERNGARLEKSLRHVWLMGDQVGNAPPRPAGLEIFDELVHGPDERVGALQDLLDTQLCPTARQFLGSPPTIVRYDDSLHQRVELESFVSVSGGVSHELHSVVDARHFPRRKIWLRSPATNGDTGEVDDVSFRCGEGEELWTVATDENGRMRLLDRQRMDFVLRHSIVLTG